MWGCKTGSVRHREVTGGENSSLRNGLKNLQEVTGERKSKNCCIIVNFHWSSMLGSDGYSPLTPSRRITNKVKLGRNETFP